MKQKIKEGLKAKFEGVQDSVISRMVEKIAKTATTEEQVTTAIEGVTIQQLIDGYADSRVTEAASTAVANYEKKHNLKDGETTASDESATKPKGKKGDDSDNKEKGDDPPAWAKSIIEANEKLTQKLAAIEGEKVTITRTKQLEKILEDLNVPDQLRSPYRKTLSRANFKDDDDFEGFLTEVKTEIEPIVASFTQKGAIIQRPITGGKGGVDPEPSPEVKARIEERKADVENSPIRGLQTPAK